MKMTLSVLALFIAVTGAAQSAGLGIFDQAADIGHPKNAGSSVYDPATQTYNMRGSGYNIWFNRDEFQYLYKKTGGDFLLTADMEFLGDAGDGHRKIGWMVRESSDEASASMNAVVHGDGLTVMQWRPLRGAYMRDPQDEIFYAKKTLFRTVQLERSGNKFTMRVANPGEPLQEVGTQAMPDMRDSVLVGLFISSHDSNKTEQARIWNVRIDKPVPSTFNPNPQIKMPASPGVMGCRLEVMDVFTGMRKVIRETDGKFEAPNWMPAGDKLLFNQGGSLYSIPIDGGTPEKMNTGLLDNLNNDHGISFNGKNAGH